jgi:hypothetical protein
MRTVVFDYPPGIHDTARDFWRVALAADIHRGRTYPEYHVLEHPAVLGSALIQSLGQGESRIHLDIESDDTEAEVARLVAAGAVEVQRIDNWVVLRDPGGLLFCVVPAELDDAFAASARTVGS